MTNSQARSAKASPIALDISRLASMIASSRAWTGRCSGDSQFESQAVMYHA